ncbi:hypothetical protein WAF17_15525 [Bernardetia sp. ABR2-2B]|uniref:hypothetical protein n=1 Tax=Bernardetia sp. ABR2-2B TaxID=3127472 RepID=UPI0030D5EEA7
MKKSKSFKRRKQKKRVKKYSPNLVKLETKKEKMTSSKVWSILLLVCLVFLFFLPREIAYPESRNDIVMSFFIVVVIPFLVYKIVIPFDEEGIVTTFICLVSTIIFGFAIAQFHDYQKEKELRMHGVKTKCFVIDRKMTYKGGSYDIKCKYLVNGKEIKTYFHNEGKNEYKVGNTLELVYNKEFPKMYRINIE